jgi:hypothetical protein
MNINTHIYIEVMSAIYLYVHMHIHIDHSIHIHTDAHTYACVCVCVCVCVFVRVFMYMTVSSYFGPPRKKEWFDLLCVYWFSYKNRYKPAPGLYFGGCPLNLDMMWIDK